MLGVTGVTFKQAVPNLVVHVTTAGDGRGLIMRSISAPWTRTELDSSFLGPSARGRQLGTLLSRGRFLLLQIVRRQIPATVASHLRGTFDTDGSAPFWRHFGLHFAPQWPTSTEAESALGADPARLADLADLVHPVEAAVLDSLGAVNAASLPAFHLLTAEGLQPNGMYDPIDGGPTLIAEIGDLSSAANRIHGRALIEPFASNSGLVEGWFPLPPSTGSVWSGPRIGSRPTGGSRSKARPQPRSTPTPMRCWPLTHFGRLVRGQHDVAMPSGQAREANFDGLVGPTHNYAGLSVGNLASLGNAGGCQAHGVRPARGWPRCGACSNSASRKACCPRTNAPTPER